MLARYGGNITNPQASGARARQWVLHGEDVKLHERDLDVHGHVSHCMMKMMKDVDD